MTKRILFVDDEPMVLSGLERSLRAMRREWEMQFVLGGPEALQAMAHAPFDVVISDMRMPGMNGAQLLEIVKKHFSQTVRMVLSGQSDRDTVFRSTKPTHQYLSKPCDVEELKQKLIRVSQIEAVPSLPSLCESLTEILLRSDPPVSEVAEIVSRDMGMTAKVLQLVNSAFLGVASSQCDPRRAVAIIGVDNLKALVLSLDLFAEASAELTGQLQDLWDHSCTIAAYARAIALAEGLEENGAQAAFTAGLLHDIGCLVLASSCGEEYAAVLRAADTQRISVVESEFAAFHSTHAQVGAYLLGLWGLPDPIVEAVAWHHEPAQAHPESFSPLLAVHGADLCYHRLRAASPAAGAIELQPLESFGLQDRLPLWEKACRQVTEMGDSHV